MASQVTTGRHIRGERQDIQRKVKRGETGHHCSTVACASRWTRVQYAYITYIMLETVEYTEHVVYRILYRRDSMHKIL